MIDFDVILQHDFSSSECKNMKNTYALLKFTTSEEKGSLRTQSVEVTLEELKQFRQEIQRIDEALT